MSSSESNPTPPLAAAQLDQAADIDLNTQQRERVSQALLEHPFPREIGRYRIQSVLGHGGMGSVYEAEQDKPHRRVALKVIRPGLLTPTMLRRFEYETEVLGRLDHPGIAKVFEASTADVGQGPQPYFAMELVAGKRLDEYVRDTHLSTDQRLKLLIDICNAVHHAHTKGVIHRDLKPGNILVTAEGQPKILDFGVARAIDSDMQATTMATESGQLVGTLPYMAPEQAAGKVNDLDTSPDVYALGVISYELLSGTMPYKLEGKALHEAVRVICEEEPSRLSSINRSLRGDVETIVQKALEKDKTRRYHTAGELAADVKRYLDYEPITARPPGTWYQLGKFARRNKLLVTGVAAVLIALAAGAIVSTYFAITANRQRAAAEQRRVEAESATEQAEAVNEFLTEDVLGAVKPDVFADKAVRDELVKRMIEPAAARMAARFKDKPLVEAAVQNAIGRTLFALGRSDLGLPYIERARDLRRRLLGDENPHTLISTGNMARLLQAEGRLEEAESLQRDALERSRRLFGDDHFLTRRTIENMAHLLQERGKHTEAESLYREVLERNRRVLGEDHRETLNCLINMGYVFLAQRRLGEAEPFLREALERSRGVLGDDHPQRLALINNLGSLAQAQGKLAEAEPLLRESMERRRRVLGEDHRDTLTAMNNFGGLLQAQGKLAEAEAIWRDVLERSRRVLGDNHLNTMKSINNMGNVLRAQGKVDEAEMYYREALERRRKALGNNHPDTLASLNSLGHLFQMEQKYAEALPLFEELYRRAPATQLPAQQVASYVARYGPCLVKLGRYQEADEPLREAERRLRETGQADWKNMHGVLTALADVCERTDRLDEAAKWRAELTALEAATRPASTPASGPTTVTAR